MEFIIWIALSIAAVVPLFKLLPHFGVKKYWAFVAIIMPIVPMSPVVKRFSAYTSRT